MKKFLFLSVILVLLGCTRNATTIFVTGTVNPWNHIDIQLVSTPMVSTVSGNVNGIPFDVNFDGWNVMLTSDIQISAGATYNISITTDEGTGSVSVIVPGDFDITSPPNDTVLSANNDVTLQWESSVNANWYRVTIHHTSNNIDDTTYTLGDTNTLIIPGRMLSDTNDLILVNVYAENGPSQIPGGEGNITGGIKGFINAESVANTAHFQVR